MERSEKLLSREQSLLLVVDMQDTLLAPIKVAREIEENIRFLVEIARSIGVPIVATTHNAEKLGRLSESIRKQLEGVPIVNKVSFSCVGSEEFVRHLQSLQRHQVVLVGIESHICILQTSLDLAAMGYSVHVPYDAVASRRKRDWKYALLRLAHSGVTVTSLESVIYEWLGEAGTDLFRQVLPLLKAREQARQAGSEAEEEEEVEKDSSDAETGDEEGTDLEEGAAKEEEEEEEGELEEDEEEENSN